MKMTPEIKLIISEDGEKIFLAPEQSEICIKLNFYAKKGVESISEPYLITRGVEQGCDWETFFAHAMTLRLGRYVQASELGALKRKLRPHVQAIRSGYQNIGNTTFPIFDDGALQAIDTVNRVLSGFKFEFERPYDPDAAFAEWMLDMTEGELLRLSRYPGSKLKSMAIEYAKRCYPHMHPWDAYNFLKRVQVNLREKYFAESES